jgi:hypothetical protein
MLRRTVLEEPAEGPCRVCTMVLSMLSQRGYSGDVSAGDYRSDAVAGFEADAVNRPHPSLAGLELQIGLSLAVEIVKCSAMIFNLPWTFTSGRWIHVDASAVDRTATAAPLTGECW